MLYKITDPNGKEVFSIESNDSHDNLYYIKKCVESLDSLEKNIFNGTNICDISKYSDTISVLTQESVIWDGFKSALNSFKCWIVKIYKVFKAACDQMFKFRKNVKVKSRTEDGVVVSTLLRT